MKFSNPFRLFIFYLPCTLLFLLCISNTTNAQNYKLNDNVDQLFIDQPFTNNDNTNHKSCIDLLKLPQIDSFSGYMYQLDSIVSSDGENMFYSYSEGINGIICACILYDIYDEAGNSFLSKLDTLWYDNQNRVNKRIEYSWIEETNSWSKYYKCLYEYDIYNNVCLEEYFYWSLEYNIWEPNSKIIFEYNEFDQIVSSEGFMGLGNGSVEWIPSGKSECILNETGLVIKRTAFLSYEDSWFENQHTYYSYDGLLLTEKYGDSWNVSEQCFLNNQKICYCYNANSDIASAMNSEWNNDNQVWVDYRIITYTYVEENLVSVVLESSYGTNQWWYESKIDNVWENNFLIQSTNYSSENGLDWIKRSRNDMAYDEISGSIVMDAWYVWNSEVNEWIPEFKEVYEVDNSHPIDGLLIPPLYAYYLEFRSVYCMPLNDKQYVWDAEQDEWNLDGEQLYYFSPFKENDIVEFCNKISVFPNPAHNEFFVQTPEIPAGTLIFIFDISGQLQHCTKINNDGRVDISVLNPGMYLIGIYNTKRTYFQKIIVK